MNDRHRITAILLLSVSAAVQLAIAPGTAPAADVKADSSATGEWNPIDLPDLIVTATRIQKNPLDLPATIEILDAVDLRMGGALSAGELFKYLSGIDLQGTGVPGSAVRLNLRGLTPGYQSERILVLEDGRRINDAYQGNVEFGLMPVQDIERIEVLHGPASALYGSNALAGVVNIISRKGGAEAYNSVSSTAGSFSTFDVNLAHGWQKGALDWFVTGSHLETAGYLKNSDGSQRDWDSRNFTGRLGWEAGDKSRVRAHSGYYTGRGTDEASDRKTTKDFQALELQHDWKQGEDDELLLRVFRNFENTEYDWKYPGLGLYKQFMHGAEMQQTLRWGERQQLIVGGEVRRDRVQIDEVAGEIRERSTYSAIYAQDEVKVTPDWLLTAGLRLDANEDFASALSPRLGLLWRPASATEIFGSFNRAHRAPALSDRYVRVLYMGMEFQGNPDLDPETLQAYELGVRHRFSPALGANFSGFFNEMEDSFDFVRQEDGVFRNENVTESWTGGLETALHWRASDSVRLTINYSFTDGEYEKYQELSPFSPPIEGKRLAYLARHKGGVLLRYAPPSGPQMQVGGRYVGERFGDAQNSPPRAMGDFIVADLGGRVPLLKGIWATFAVDNVFDRVYREYPDYEQPGRMVRGGLNWIF